HRSAALAATARRRAGSVMIQIPTRHAPRKRGIQYTQVAAIFERPMVTGSPAFAGDDDVGTCMTLLRRAERRRRGMHRRGEMLGVDVLPRAVVVVVQMPAAYRAKHLGSSAPGGATPWSRSARAAISRRRRVRVIIWSDGARCSNVWSVTGPMLSVIAWSCRWMPSMPL